MQGQGQGQGRCLTLGIRVYRWDVGYIGILICIDGLGLNFDRDMKVNFEVVDIEALAANADISKTKLLLCWFCLGKHKNQWFSARKTVH